MMKYEFKSTLGQHLEPSMKPYQRVVNNGCTIEVQDESLLKQLYDDERNPDAPIIDWWLFKPGKTVLTDNFGRKFACNMNHGGDWIELQRLLE